MASLRLVRGLAAAVLAIPLALVATPEEAEAGPAQRYTITQKFTWQGGTGSRMVTCRVPGDFAISHRLTGKTGPASVRSVTFYSERTGNYTHPEGLYGWEGMVLEWRDGRNRPGSVTVHLTCESD